MDRRESFWEEAREPFECNGKKQGSCTGTSDWFSCVKNVSGSCPAYREKSKDLSRKYKGVRPFSKEVEDDPPCSSDTIDRC